VYVADNLAKDFVAPNSLGWLTVHYVSDVQVHREQTAPAGGRPHLTLGNLGGLPELLKLKIE
jgi:putative hydrolase of the HAD superfamily